MRRLIVSLLCPLLVTGLLARSRKPRNQSSGVAGQFDYYILSLSYAPDFCAQPGGQKDVRECGAGRKVSFVVHGLWPETEAGGHPERCKSVSPVSSAILQRTVAYIPSESLIQHEWTNHGSCSGLSPAAFFDTVRRAADSITIPADLRTVSHEMEVSSGDIEAKFIQANPKLQDAVHATCTNGALQEVRVCLGKDLTPRACGAKVNSCPSRMTMLPVR